MIENCTANQDLINSYRSVSLFLLAKSWHKKIHKDNPLYDVFTVRQHLLFFASLRGVGEQVQESRVMEVLSALGSSAEKQLLLKDVEKT